MTREYPSVGTPSPMPNRACAGREATYTPRAGRCAKRMPSPPYHVGRAREVGAAGHAQQTMRDAHACCAMPNLPCAGC